LRAERDYGLVPGTLRPYVLREELPVYRLGTTTTQRLRLLVRRSEVEKLLQASRLDDVRVIASNVLGELRRAS
jgi:hypothetical protein